MTQDELNTILLRSWEILSVLAFVDSDAYDRTLEGEAELRVTAQSIALLVMEKLQIAIQGVEQWKR